MNRSWIALTLGFCLPTALAQDGVGDLTKQELAAKLNGVDASDLSESPIEGIYEVAVGTNVAYISSDGRYLLQGEIYDIDTSRNLTEQTRSSTRTGILSTVDRDTMLVFSPADGDVKHTVTIFTDIDCGYCRQFHRDIDEVNALGIEVRYLFYPRTGPDTESWAKADKVWCADDRNTAFTRATGGGAVPEETCANTPVSTHYDLGLQVGVRGTPAIFSASGDLLGGYLPPGQLLERLDEPSL
ncbi:DsbC family protein [Candidatus Rariloculus sp.]|uniref:DsbC family protein n=1 Tax=Candidatus Rariloculus sp. TaxID=3101265 RepID=UPI003D0B27E9